MDRGVLTIALKVNQVWQATKEIAFLSKRSDVCEQYIACTTAR